MQKRKECLKEVRQLPGYDTIPEKRNAIVRSRGRDHPAPIKSTWTQIEAVFDGAWKSLAARSGDLDQLFCEHSLADKEPDLPKRRVAPALLPGPNEARRVMNQSAVPGEGEDGVNITAILKAKEHKVAGEDPTFSLVESLFFQGMAGDTPMKLLQDKALDALPGDADKDKTLKVTSKALTDAKQSKLFKFAGSGPQGALTTTRDLVESLQSLEAPDFPKNPSTFHSTVIDKLAFFCRAKIEGRKAYGAEAAAKNWSEVKAANDANTKEGLAKLREVVSFGWLLSTTDLAQATLKLRDARKRATATLVEAAATKTAKAAVAPIDAASSSKDTGKRAAANMDAAMAMFKKIKK